MIQLPEVASIDEGQQPQSIIRVDPIGTNRPRSQQVHARREPTAVAISNRQIRRFSQFAGIQHSRKTVATDQEQRVRPARCPSWPVQRIDTGARRLRIIADGKSHSSDCRRVERWPARGTRRRNRCSRIRDAGKPSLANRRIFCAEDTGVEFVEMPVEPGADRSLGIFQQQIDASELDRHWSLRSQ